MITVRKLSSLKDGTRQRKIIKILGEWERDASQGSLPDADYLRDFLKVLSLEPSLAALTSDPDALLSLRSEDPQQMRRIFNRIRHELLKTMGTAAADWDMIHPEDKGSEDRRPFPYRIFLDEIRSPYNLGSIFRTAECMGVAELYLSPGTADPSHPRCIRTSMGCTERVPWKRMDYSALSQEGLNVFCMELGGESLTDFHFPKEGILILGSEELGVSPECLALSKASSGVVTINQFGSKSSLNVSVAFGIVMNAWAQSFA